MFINKFAAQCADMVVDVESDSMSNRTHCLPSGHFFNLATHMQAHARTCYDFFFYRKFDAVLINDASQFACFFSVYNCKILMHMYINMYN